MPLTLIPTPLGNLRDISLRALDTLKSASLIVAEDTRVTQRLLWAHGISGIELIAFHAHSQAKRITEIIERARVASVVAVSDAGMPGISDPGSDLIRAAREANLTIDLLPGPCAFVSAAVLSGFPIVGLRFEGFVPRTPHARRSAFENALKSGCTTAWYESPHRILLTLKTLAEIEQNAQIFLLREYTKLFEQQALGTPESITAALALPVRGEITLVIAGHHRSTLNEKKERKMEDFEERFAALAATRLSTAAIAKQLAAEGWGTRSALYLSIAQRGKPSDAKQTQS